MADISLITESELRAFLSKGWSGPLSDAEFQALFDRGMPRPVAPDLYDAEAISIWCLAWWQQQVREQQKIWSLLSQ